MRAAGVPPAIEKACCDPFEYGCCLRDGRIVYFGSAAWSEHSPQWVTLLDVKSMSPEATANGRPLHSFNFDRGIEVRICDIMWAADAPYGS